MSVTIPDGSWLNGPLVAFDTETTGVNWNDDRIVTCAVSTVGPGTQPDHHSWLLDPEISISDSAASVHGITTEHARAHGQTARDGVEEIIHTLTIATAGGAPIVAMNARFDLTLLDREARRHNLIPLTERANRLRVIDPFVLDKFLDQWRRGPRKLYALCHHYGVTLNNAHDAFEDAIAAARLTWKICATAQVAEDRNGSRTEKGHQWNTVRHDLDQLHEAQVRWAHDQAESLRDYFKRQENFDAAEQVEPVWPIAPPLSR